MITIKVSHDKIEMSGHADYAEYGKDIVCAGVTALVQSLTNSLIWLTDDNPEHLERSGTFYMRTDKLSDKGSLLIDSFLIGIESIAEEFPQNVKVINMSRRGTQ